MSRLLCVFVMAVFVVMSISVPPSRAWFFRYIFNGGTRNCFCKAVDMNNHGSVIKDFGSIRPCHGWPNCSCGRPEIAQCNSHCDVQVKKFAREGCLKGMKGRKIVGHYKGSSCRGNLGPTNHVYTCQ